MKYLYTSLLILTLAAAANVGAEPADLETIKGLAAEGERELALQKLDERVAANSQDVQARFLKGLLLIEQGDTRAALQVFMEISEAFPDLPEPYNNLAALYAREGNYEKARQTLLSAAASAPEYSVVRANLGDLYVNLAVDAYRRAIALDPKDQASQAKLKMLERLFAPGS